MIWREGKVLYLAVRGKREGDQCGLVPLFEPERGKGF